MYNALILSDMLFSDPIALECEYAVVVSLICTRHKRLIIYITTLYRPAFGK